MKAYIAVLVVFILAINCLKADDVYLKSGRVLQGKAIKRGNKIEVKMGAGSVFIKKTDILKIVSKEAPHEIFNKKYAAVDKNNPEALMDLAKWCKKNLSYEYERIHREAKKARMKQIIAANYQEFNQMVFQAGKNPDELYKVATWASQKYLPENTREDLLKRIIGLDPEHAGARGDLGQVKYQGRWMSAAEAKKLEARDFAVGMRAKGYIFLQGEWVKPEEAKIKEYIETLKQNISKAEKERDEAKKALQDEERKNQEKQRSIDDLKWQLKRSENELESKRRKLNSAEDEIQDLQEEIRTLRKRIRNLEEKPHVY